jgi:DNA-binding response OmpR family regulator
MTSAPRVLLVDPADSRDSLADRLRMQGYVVTVARDCAAGAHLALSDPPAIVVADLWMSGISGIQLCRLLKSEPATESVPVIRRGPESNGPARWPTSGRGGWATSRGRWPTR